MVAGPGSFPDELLRVCGAESVVRGDRPWPVYPVEKAVADDGSVLEFAKKSPEQNFEDFRTQLGDNADVLDGFDPSLLSWSFTVRLQDPAQGAAFAAPFSFVMLSGERTCESEFVRSRSIPTA